MTTQVISAHLEMSLGEASALLMKHGLSGLPVVDDVGKLLGIVTEYDLVSKGSMIHIPTFLKLIKDIELYRKDRALMRDELKSMLSLKVKDVMNKEPLTIGPDVPIEEGVKIFSEHHRVNPIPVVEGGKVVGVLSRFDIMKLYAPAREVYSFFGSRNQSVDKGIDQFVRDFEREFVLVKKSRPRLWLLTSLIFLLIGFIAAFFFVLRINIRILF